MPKQWSNQYPVFAPLKLGLSFSAVFVDDFPRKFLRTPDHLKVGPLANFKSSTSHVMLVKQIIGIYPRSHYQKIVT